MAGAFACKEDVVYVLHYGWTELTKIGLKSLVGSLWCISSHRKNFSLFRHLRCQSLE